MKFSEQWLREWINPPVSAQELADQLTLIGLEVDEVNDLKPEFSGVVVARIDQVEQHPDADKLRVCQVDAGHAGKVQIVCGAPNVRDGMYAPLATVGAKLPGGMKVKKAKLRGVDSHGMLCSGSELGIADDDSGLMELSAEAEPGMAIEELLDLNDSVFEVELTPNRGDCFSIRGIARDLSARTDKALQLHEITAVKAAHDQTQPVTVAPDCACVRYVGRVITGVDSSAATPLWMVERLFDLAKVQGNIGVRRAKEREKVVLLDGRDIALESDTTVITDDRGAIGIAGIMGGDSTGVDETTRDIFFEAALFLPIEISGKPRRYDAHTDRRGVRAAGGLAG